MDETALTIQQIVLLVLFVLPGISYQFVRERVRGPVPGEQDLGQRVLRAVTASIALDALYLIIAGPQLLRLIKQTGQPWFAASGANLRQAALVALALFIAIPAAAAWAVGQVQQRHRPARFRPEPTAWDYIFRSRSACFVRARLKSGLLGGRVVRVEVTRRRLPQSGRLLSGISLGDGERRQLRPAHSEHGTVSADGQCGIHRIRSVTTSACVSTPDSAERLGTEYARNETDQCLTRRNRRFHRRLAQRDGRPDRDPWLSADHGSGRARCPAHRDGLRCPLQRPGVEMVTTEQGADTPESA